MIFGVDAMNHLEGRNSHNDPRGLKRSAVFGSSNITRAMRTDPLWKESIEVKQAVQDQFPLIGEAAKRLSLEKKGRNYRDK